MLFAASNSPPVVETGVELWGQMEFYLSLNQPGRGRVGSVDGANPDFLDFLFNGQPRFREVGRFNAVHELLWEDPSIWSKTM